MTYKELIFKMARRGMLSLSNDKDGRGLFWMGMSNMEALEKEFDYIDKQGRKQERCEDFEYRQYPFKGESENAK